MTYLVAISIDGFIAASDGGISPLLVEGTHLEALIERYPETFPAQVREPLGITATNRVFDTVIMGSNTYRVPGAPQSPYPHLHQIVVTSDATDVPKSITVWSRDVASRVATLKQTPGGAIWLCGGGSLAASLLPHVDRLLLKITPVVLGDGVKLFEGLSSEPTGFDLVGTERFDSGVFFAEYRRAAPPSLLAGIEA